MYVAMTRAKKQLYISRARERYMFGNYSANPTSRFIKEIPEELIERLELVSSFSSSFNNNYNSFSFDNFILKEESLPKTKTRTIIQNDINNFSL
jgi:DNA helicase II / ATP-dependent DNA helicase PcrA